jgi:hypothetical protein
MNRTRDRYIDIQLGQGSFVNKYYRFTAWTHTQVVALLNEAIARAEIVPLDAAYTADILMAAMSPALLHYQRHDCGYSTERIIEGMQWLFVDRIQQS